MLHSTVFVQRISRSRAVPSLSRFPVPPALFSNSHGIISFADPHHLNSVASYRYKNIGPTRLRRLAAPASSLAVAIKSFFFKLLRTLLQFLTFSCTPAKLKSFSFSQFRTLCKKHRGVGVFFPFWNSSPSMTNPILVLSFHA